MRMLQLYAACCMLRVHCREALESLNMSLFLALGCQLHTAQRRCPPSHM